MASPRALPTVADRLARARRALLLASSSLCTLQSEDRSTYRYRDLECATRALVEEALDELYVLEDNFDQAQLQRASPGADERDELEALPPMGTTH